MTNYLEKEDVILDMLTRLKTHGDSPLVTEDWDKVEHLKQLPMILLVERPDLVKRIVSDMPVKYSRSGFLSTLSFVRGSSGERAPGELRAFQTLLRTVVYKDKLRRIGSQGAGISEHMASQVVFPQQGEHVVLQEIVWRVSYRENTGRLFKG
jgi:hypothetical protein